MACEQPKLVVVQICMNQLGFYVAATSKTNCTSRVARRYVCLQLFKHVQQLKQLDLLISHVTMQIIISWKFMYSNDCLIKLLQARDSLKLLEAHITWLQRCLSVTMDRRLISGVQGSFFTFYYVVCLHFGLVMVFPKGLLFFLHIYSVYKYLLMQRYFFALLAESVKDVSS